MTTQHLNRSIQVTLSPAPQPRKIAAFAAVAVGGMLVHNALELGPAFLLTAEATIPVLLFAALAWLVQRPASGTASRIALLAWTLLNLVGGGFVSVLPLGFLPFVPDQSLAHYAAHAVYAIAQVPLALLALRLLRRSRATPAAGVRA